MANPPAHNEPLHEEKERVWLPEPICWRRCTLLVRYVNDAIFFIDTQGRIVEANEPALELYGYSDAEMRTLHVKDIRAAEAQAEAQAHFESLRERGSALYRTVHRRKNGTNFPAEVSARWIKTGASEFVVAVIRDLSEVERASRRYATAVESAMDGYAVIGAKGQFLEVNAALCALTGRSRHELLCLTISDMEVVEAQSHTAARMTFINASGHDRFECQWKRKDGAIIDVEITATYGAQNGGEFFCFIRDITERKQASDALRESEEKYSSLVMAMAEGVVMRDASGAIVACNQSADRILGLDSGELIGRTSIILEGGSVREDGSPYAAEDRPSVLTLHTGKPNTIAVRGIRKPDGTMVWISGNSQPLFKPGATTPYAVVTTFRDITDRKQAEDALRASEERFRSLVEQSFTGIYAIRDDKIVYANPRFAELLGYTLDEIIGMNPDSFVVAEDLPLTQASLRALLEGEQRSAAYNFRARRKDGTVIELGLRGARSVFDGKPTVICMSQDITERKRAEETQSRLEAQLREAQKMEAIGTLAGGIAHDFNNQLTVIKGCVQFLLEALGADHPGREDAERINATVEKGATLIRQLMAYSRKQKIQPRPLSLADLVNEVAAMLGPLLSERILLRVRTAPGVWRVRADPGQIEQVVVNLAINARDAMAATEAAGTLTVELVNVELDEASSRLFEESVPAGPYVMFAVSDTGCGMSSEVRKRIFEPFFTTKEPGKGTGLGLSMVFGIVKQHGGYITCESEPGHGSTFRVYLPRDEEEAAPADALTLTAVSGPPGGETMTVLVAEDDENVREIVRRGLEASGYQVHVAAGPEEALAVASAIRGPIHLLVTDVVMAGGGGRNLAERLRAIAPALKVLFISGYFDETPTGHEVVDAFFLQKPFSPDDLAQKAGEVLGR